MKVKLTMVCDIDMPEVEGVQPQHVAETAKEVAERVLQAAFRKAGFSVQSTAVVLNSHPKPE